MPLFRFSESGLFRPDNLSFVMAGLIIFVIANVVAFSSRYMAGDRNLRRHQRSVMLLGACVLLMVFADHLLVLLAGWAAGNLLLVKLMIHKSEWGAARTSGLLALKAFAIGFLLLVAGFWLLAQSAGTASIHGLNSSQAVEPTMAFSGLFLVALAAMTQSAAWPFHRWLLSSLNSPTPVSALMHAGLVNGGGFILVRFAPLYLSQPFLLHVLFIAGLITAVVGTFWKLLQPDVKRMLACSTMGQMGFMLMQCGIGLFGPAVSHLCWHGLFKAYLFLGAASVVREKRSIVSAGCPTLLQCFAAALAGVAGAAAFTLTSDIRFDLRDTGCLMAGLAFMAAAQLALRLMQTPNNPLRLFAMPVVGLIAGSLYGFSVRFVDIALGSSNVTQPQPLDVVYGTGFAVILMVWIAMNLNFMARIQSHAAWKRLYVAALNGSQPHPRTVTAIRTGYRY